MASSLMLLTYPYRPDPRVYREARALIRHGFEVQLIAWDREGGRPAEAVEDGVRVIRLGPRCRYRSAVRVVGGLARFSLGALRTSRRLRFDLVHAHDFDTLPLGLLISRLRRVPLLYDAHELYSAMVAGELGIFSRILWVFEKHMSMMADEIITVNETLASRLSEGRAKPARIVTNSPDTGVLDGVDPKQVRDRYGLRGFVVSYLGSLEPGRFVNELLGSMEPGAGVTLAIGGDGTLRPAVEKAASSNSKIKFLGTLDTDEALRVTYASDLVVAMLDPGNPNYRTSTPVKVLDAMACGRPVVTTEGLEISDLLKRIGCAFVIPYDRQAFRETLALAQADPKLLVAMGRKGKEHFEKELSWPRSRDELLKAYKALAGGP